MLKTLVCAMLLSADDDDLILISAACVCMLYEYDYQIRLMEHIMLLIFCSDIASNLIA